MWFLMYCVAFTFPDVPTGKEKREVSRFFKSIGNVLPCKLCKKNYKSHLKKYPLTPSRLADKKSLVGWVLRINNETNKETEGPVLTYKKVADKFLREAVPPGEGDEEGWVSLSGAACFASVVLCLLCLYALHRGDYLSKALDYFR